MISFHPAPSLHIDPRLLDICVFLALAYPFEMRIMPIGPFSSMTNQIQNMNVYPKKGFINLMCLSMMMLGWQMGYAQNYEWEIEKMERREASMKVAGDSVIQHMKNRWEIKLAYGSWFFSSRAKSGEEELFFFPNRSSIWELRTAWHLTEHLSVGLGVGIQIIQNPPESPNIGSVLSGEDFEIEGSGGALFPVDLGLKYYFVDKRWRPYVGVSGGLILGRSLYTVAEGNITDGVTRTDFETASQAFFGDISTGIDYRLGLHTSASLNFSYTFSSDFDEVLGGYTTYEGFLVNAGFSIVL